MRLFSMKAAVLAVPAGAFFPQSPARCQRETKVTRANANVDADTDPFASRTTW